MSKSFLLLFAFLLVPLQIVFSQVEYEKGYFINSSQQRIECFIKNIDWLNNPSEFKYKTDSLGSSKNSSLDSIIEFGVYKKSKFIKRKVKIDLSSQSLEDLTESRNPVMEEKTLFLKAIIEGKASLYLYKKDNNDKYFFSVNGSNIEQLIFRKYKVGYDGFQVNNGFRQQLWSFVSCDKTEQSVVEKLNYELDDLTSYIFNYNLWITSIFWGQNF